jgi:hypothetical protein
LGFGTHRFPSLRRRSISVISVLALVGVAVVAIQSTAVAGPCDAPVNVIVCENSKAGTPADTWDIWGAGDEGIQGFATDMSVNVGQPISFKVKTTASSYTIDIYRLGYYQGNGARKIISVTPVPRNQPDCITDPATEIYDCGNWAVSASWTVPSTAVSGVYLAHLKRPDNGDESHITFVVRNDASTSKVLFKTSDATWQAYNMYGGSNFYRGQGNGRAFKLSYNRPFATRDTLEGRDFLYSNEYPMIRFLERNGYDVSYFTDVDGERRGNLVANHDLFLSVGHDEYWSGPQRAYVEAARDTGTSLAFFSGNEVYWKTRWENSQDGNNVTYRTLVCYKETWNNAKIDPSAEWTGTWRDPRLSPPSNGGKPENALTGTLYFSNSVDLPIQVPEQQGKNRMWRNTSVAGLSTGQTATLAPHTVGYEANEDRDNGFRPAGLIRLSTTVGPTPELLTDFGNNVDPGTTTHNTTLYRAASGALVFSAGTVQWAWGLDQNHDGFATEPADNRMQQATINLFADMGVQPTSLMSGMVMPTASTDTVGPTISFTSPAANASFANGTQVTVQGTATDSGGRVAGIEVSTDGGVTWHPATGTSSWSYSYFATGDGVSTVRVRGIDDSARIGATATRDFVLTGPTSLFGNRVPTVASVADTSSVELGTKFIPSTDGYVHGVRFYKGSGNTGTHSGRLWSGGGSLLASGTFTGESATGWQTLTFSTPVGVVADNTYVVSYTAPNGRYAADAWFFIYKNHVAPPLVAPRNLEAGGNGVYGNPGSFPGSSYQAANYYVDALFTSATTTPPDVISVSPQQNALYVSTATTAKATFNKPINPATLQFTLTGTGGGSIAGTVTYDGPSKTATFTPSSALPAGTQVTASARASDNNGNTMPTPKVWTFTTDPGSTTVHTLFAPNATPATAASNDPNSVSLGVRFTPTSDGNVVGVRFYKGAGNGGVHIGSLWSSTGTRLATATFTSESASGWQTVYFSPVVPVTAGTTYVASYFAPLGRYSANSGYFNSALTNGPLTAPAGNNGVYSYGGDSFPSGSWGNTNYWVDPLFVATPPPPQPTPPPGSVTVFAPSATPANANWNDSAAIEVGMAFTTDVAGVVNGVRFYKGSLNTGAHTGSLYTSTGTLLATGNFVSESGSGWQTMLFTSPVSVTPGTTYVVSYSMTAGRYGVTVNGLASPIENGPLNTLAGSGRYKYGSGFPNSTANHNYWVDVVFTPSS